MLCINGNLSLRLDEHLKPKVCWLCWPYLCFIPQTCLPAILFAANLTLSFSYPVELAQLAQCLVVAGQGAGGRTLTVSPCMTPRVLPWPVPLVFTASGIQNNAAAGSSPADLLKLNSTCAVIKIVPGLEPGAAAVLRLPKGARYSPVAGPVATDTDVNVSAACYWAGHQQHFVVWEWWRLAAFEQCIRAWWTVHDWLCVVHLYIVGLCSLGLPGWLPALHVGTACQAPGVQKTKTCRWLLQQDVLSCVCLQVYGLRPFRIPLRWDFTNISNIKEDLYNGIT